jgi:hypothetical protein
VGENHVGRPTRLNFRLRRQPIDQPRYCSIFPSHGARNLHAVALVESANDRIFPSHAKVQIAARRLRDLTHKLLEHATTRATELLTVYDLVDRNRASRDVNLADASFLAVFLKCDSDVVLVDALVPLDAALERVLPNVREHVPVRLEMPVDCIEVTEIRVSHGYRFLKTKIGSLLKALFPMCFSPTILLS